jgi:type VI secretion system secreted protein VgrG
VVRGAESVTVAQSQQIGIHKNQQCLIGENRTVKAGLVHELSAGKALELRCGNARIRLEEGGKIEIEGRELLLTATGGDVVVKGDKIFLN